MISGACYINFEEGPDTATELIAGFKGDIEDLENFLKHRLIDEECLINYINLHFWRIHETCAFCKGEIHKTEKGTCQDKVILYTTDMEIIKDLKRLVDENVLVIMKPFKDPELHDTTHYFILMFRYWDIDHQLENWILSSIKGRCETAEDWRYKPGMRRLE